MYMYSLKLQVEILFEETFYNSKDESYRVLCVSELFSKDPATGKFNSNINLLVIMNTMEH